MPRYLARYVGRSGRRARAVIDAVDLTSLSEHIEKNRKAYIVEVQKVAERGLPSFRTKVSGPLLLTALDSLELMLTSGVRINAALRTIADCAPPGPARRMWTEIVKLVEESGSFANSLRHFPRVFSGSMIGVIAAHEATGRLADGIKSIRNYVGQMQEIRRESLRGLTYPALVCTVGLVSSLVLCEFTLPRFSKMLRDIGAVKTNRVTSFFFGLSDLVVHHPVFVAASLCVPPFLAWMAFRPRFRPYFDVLMLNLPVVGRAAEALSMARICVTFRALAESGIRVVESLDFCAAAAGNVVYTKGIEQVISSVRENVSVGTGFERAGIFAPEVVLAVKSGEHSLSQVFGRLADYYTSESKHRIALALELIEPAVLIAVLAWVFGVALAVVLPVVEIINEVH